ncbi:MAG: hypothetical protein K1X83_13020 [Oligoflexia bacterium]|nr:hypothetical protein [Oligoflexia bacterium]
MQPTSPTSPLKLDNWPKRFEDYQSRCADLGVTPLVDEAGFNAALTDARAQIEALEDWKNGGSEKIAALHKRIMAKPEEALYASIGVYAHLNRIAGTLPPIPNED